MNGTVPLPYLQLVGGFQGAREILLGRMNGLAQCLAFCKARCDSRGESAAGAMGVSGVNARAGKGLVSCGGNE